MKKAHLARHPLQDYRNRDCVMWLLDDGVFDQMNTGDFGINAALAGCLDALDHIPAGSMVSVPPRYYDASVVTRGVSAEEQKRIDDFLNEVFELRNS